MVPMEKPALIAFFYIINKNGSFFTRIIHLMAALSFSLIVVPGLTIIFGSYLDGSRVIRAAKYTHLISAVVFAFPCLQMFIIWLKDMLPQPHDIAWLLILDGYLSKKKKPLPAGKFKRWYRRTAGILICRL